MAISSPSFLINATLFFGLSTRHIPQEVIYSKSIYFTRIQIFLFLLYTKILIDFLFFWLSCYFLCLPSLNEQFIHQPLFGYHTLDTCFNLN